MLTELWQACQDDLAELDYYKGNVSGLSTTIFRDLVFWIDVAPVRRGTETVFLPDNLRTAGKARRAKHIESILDIQRQCFRGCMDPSKAAEMMKTASVQHSRASKNWARVMAQADEVVCCGQRKERVMDQTTKARRNSRKCRSLSPRSSRRSFRTCSPAQRRSMSPKRRMVRSDMPSRSSQSLSPMRRSGTNAQTRELSA